MLPCMAGGTGSSIGDGGGGIGIIGTRSKNGGIAVVGSVGVFGVFGEVGVEPNKLSRSNPPPHAKLINPPASLSLELRISQFG